MGVYMFSWQVLKDVLIRDEAERGSSNDFGKDIIPTLLSEGARMFSYRFDDYWKDVGTIDSLWEANMDLLEDHPPLELNDRSWRIFTVSPNQPAQFIAPAPRAERSFINEGCFVEGDVNRSVLFHGVHVGEGSVVEDSVLMPGASLVDNATIIRAIVGEGAIVEDGCQVGSRQMPRKSPSSAAERRSKPKSNYRRWSRYEAADDGRH